MFACPFCEFKCHGEEEEEWRVVLLRAHDCSGAEQFTLTPLREASPPSTNTEYLWRSEYEEEELEISREIWRIKWETGWYAVFGHVRADNSLPNLISVAFPQLQAYNPATQAACTTTLILEQVKEEEEEECYSLPAHETILVAMENLPPNFIKEALRAKGAPI